MSNGSGKSRKVLEVINVSKTYYPPTHWLKPAGPDDPRVKKALQDVSLDIDEGEMVALLGPNGAGKTTLSKIVTTLMHPTSGEVRLFGRDIRDDSYEARAGMGLVTCDERSFYWRLTGRQNLKFFGALYRVSKIDIEERSAVLLDTLDLTLAADRPYHTYSSGMKQKLAIARGLLSQPRLVIYDEPTRSLDPLSAQRIRRWILEQRKNLPEQTHLIATNQLNEAELLCDRVFIINGGRLIAQGTVAEIRALSDLRDLESHRIEISGNPYQPSAETAQHPTIIQLSIEQIPGGMAVQLTAQRNSEALSVVLREIAQSGATIARCSVEQTSFDEVFCSVIEAETADAQRRNAP